MIVIKTTETPSDLNCHKICFLNFEFQYSETLATTFPSFIRLSPTNKSLTHAVRDTFLPWWIRKTQLINFMQETVGTPLTH